MKKIYFFLMAMMVAFAANAWTVKFTNPSNWESVCVYVYNGAGEVCGKWPGAAMTQDGDVWTYTTEKGAPAKIIFNNNDKGAQTGNLDFVDGATYDLNGPVGAEMKDYKVYFKNEANWDKVCVYAWGPESFGAWPGTELTAGADGLYTVTVTATAAPSFLGILFNNGGDLKTGDLQWETDKVYTNGNGGDDPQPGTYPATLYLVGDATGWLDGGELAMTTLSDGVYEATLDFAASANFRFMGEKVWSTTEQWGGAADDMTNVPAVEGSNTLVQGKGNFTIPAAGNYTVKVDLANMTMTLTLNGGEIPAVLPEKLYLVGAATNWAVDEAMLMTKVDNVYTLNCMCPEGKWKIWDGTWDWSFGPGDVTAPEAGVAADAWFVTPSDFNLDETAFAGKEIIINFTAVEGSYVKGSSVPSIITITIDTSDVQEVAVAEGEAVYFNLQGQKVANPENGIYVKVVDGKASKVLVK